MIYNEDEFKYFLKITQPEKYERIKNIINLNILESYNKCDFYKFLEIHGFNIIDNKKHVVFITINVEKYLTFIRKLKLTYV